MPASEETYYNLSRLHLVFAVSAVVLVAVTVWMIAADYRRPWKQYQAVYRDRVEPWLAQAAWLQRQVEAAAGRPHPAKDERAAPSQQPPLQAPGDGAGQPAGTRRPTLGERLLRLPGLEALARPLRIEQLWLPDLPLDYHFRQVPRFDRCTTCHWGIDRPWPAERAQDEGTSGRVLKLDLPAPSSLAGEVPSGASPLPNAGVAEPPYGIVLSPKGVLDDDVPTVGAIRPRSPAAFGGLRPGDAILRIDETLVMRRGEAEAMLSDLARHGKPARIEVRRGLPQPFSAHPRLDLWVGEKSPHPASRFGCTICHDGQGSATDFCFANHTPNDPAQRRQWQKQYGWFGSKGWAYPMRPARFAQSNCLKCHFEVVDLEPGGRFLDPPAPKLLEGYHRVRQLGCFGCHEIAGFDPAQRPVGPDLRLEPPYHEAAAALLAEGYLDPPTAELARQIIARPEQPQARRQLLALLKSRKQAQGPPEKFVKERPGVAGAEAPSRQARRETLLAVLETEPTPPGTMRKVGPSLRHIADKLEAAYLEAFVANPAALRPSSRMPRLFGLDAHLQGSTLQETRRFEAVEIRAIAEYLLAASQPMASLQRPPAGAEKPSADRGKRLFQRHGCLACHRHADFPEGKATQGPDLSGLGGKLRGPRGQAWLKAWLRDPTRYSPRTAMPNPLLEPENAPAEPYKGVAADPVADIAAYLLQPGAAAPQPLPEPPDDDLDRLLHEHLARTFSPAMAEEILRGGIAEGLAEAAGADAVELLGPLTRAKKLRYLGRRTIGKRGCFGCHEVPGFEDAQPIGPPLTGWGRKDPSLLDFGQVHRFLGLDRGVGLDRGQSPEPAQNAGPPAAVAAEGGQVGQGADHGFYLEALRTKGREGFLWQKLRQPRSFDYALAANKPFGEQLLMGQFALSDTEREAIMTFVLGLVAEPPPPARLPHPDARRRALIEGRKVLDQYACPACHTMELERWTIEYDPAKFPAPPAGEDYPFLQPQLPAQVLADSLRTDLRGLARSELVGMPQYNAQGQLEETEDDEGDPAYAFLLWEPAAIAGKVWPTGSASVLVSQKQLARRRPPWGGEFARLLYPVVLKEARSAGSTATVLEAWGWVPPPLVHEGSAVQPAWLHDYLLAPYVIRPAAALRMPRYNLSAGEAARLVDYFAARSGAEFPYASDPRTQAARQERPDPERWARHQQAIRLVTDRTTYCAKCHLVGDFGPGGQNLTVLAPNLQRVGQRLRPEYVRRWLANPRSVLPYTAMPVNFPLGKSMGQDLLPGTSAEQLDAVLDLLLNYQGYLRSRVSIRAMVEETPPNRAEAAPQPPQK